MICNLKWSHFRCKVFTSLYTSAMHRLESQVKFLTGARTQERLLASGTGTHIPAIPQWMDMIVASQSNVFSSSASVSGWAILVRISLGKCDNINLLSSLLCSSKFPLWILSVMCPQWGFSWLRNAEVHLVLFLVSGVCFPLHSRHLACVVLLIIFIICLLF